MDGARTVDGLLQGTGNFALIVREALHFQLPVAQLLVALAVTQRCDFASSEQVSGRLLVSLHTTLRAMCDGGTKTYLRSLISFHSLKAPLIPSAATPTAAASWIHALV